MADFYDYTDSRYYEAIKRSVKVYKWKLELLDYQDGVIKEIVIDMDSSNAGSINSSNAQGSCRSCSFTFTNPDNHYSLIENNPFWDRRRFKLYIGLVNGEDIYWFSKGVYITKNASMNQHSISVQAVDKYGLLDGSLNVAPAFLKTKFEAGMKIGDVIRLILLQDIGNGMVLDATEPIIDPDIANLKLYKDFEMDIGTYYGALLDDILTPLGCDIYYDALGRLIVNRRFDDVLPYWNFHLGVAYTFSDKDINYQEPNNSYEFNGANYIVVETDDNSVENARYVLENHNPQSPVCVEKVGYKAYDNGSPVYISAGDTSIDTPERKCKEYAEYMLLQHTCHTVTKTFNTPILPHMDARNTIRVSDDPMIEDNEVMLVTSLSIPFGVPNDMGVTATNIQWLLTDEESTSLTCEVGSRSVPKYTLSYNGIVKDADNQDITFSDVDEYEGSAVILATSGAVYDGYDLGYFNTDKVFSGWRDNQIGTNHAPGSLYTIPAQNVTMTPQWVNAQKAVISIYNTNPGSYYARSLESNGNRVPETAYLQTMNKYSNKMYTSGDAFNPRYIYTQYTAGEFEIDYLYPPEYENALSALGAQAVYGANSIKSINLSGLTTITSLSDTIKSMNQLESFDFPVNLTSVTSNEFLKSCPKLKSVTFPVGSCLIEDNNFLKSAGGTGMANSFTIPSNITIKGTSFLNECNIGKQLIVNCNLTLTGQPFAFVVPSSVEELQLNGNMHFSRIDTSGANSLNSITIGANVQIDNYSGFAYQKSFDVVISDSHITTINNAFIVYAGSSVVINSTSVTEITNSFGGSSLASFEFPANITLIQNCFNGSGLTSVVLNNSLQTISNSFNGCGSLDNVVVPASVTSLVSSFSGCFALQTITFLNPTLDLSGFPVNNLTKVKGYAGSTAETFANDNNITFEAIS